MAYYNECMSDILKPKIYNVDRYVLSTVLYKPTGKGPFPAVIVLPGFTGYKEEGQIEGVARQLAENGIVALTFDPTGFGASEGTITEDYRISIYMNDIDTMYNYLKHQEFVKDSAIGLWGHSMGGMLAICYGADYPSAIHAVIAVSCPQFIGSSMWLKEEMAKWEKDKKLEIVTAKFGNITVPYAFVKDGHSYSALESAKSLKQPILVAVGHTDDTVAESDTKAVYNAIPENKELLEVPDLKHNFEESSEAFQKIFDASVTFFQTQLK